MGLACENSRPFSLPARVAIREKDLLLIEEILTILVTYWKYICISKNYRFAGYSRHFYLEWSEKGDISNQCLLLLNGFLESGVDWNPGWNSGLRNVSKTSASVSSGFQTRENWWKHEAAGRVLLLFSSVWNPDETRSTSFWNYLELQQRKLVKLSFE